MLGHDSVAVMKIKPIKSYLPRNLYGRAALILLLPIILLQLLVSVVFIQRHFEGVTDLMTVSIVRELELVLAMEDPSETAQALRIEVRPDLPVPDQSYRAFYDLSGRAMLSRLDRDLPGLVAYDLSDGGSVWLWIERGDVTRAFGFSRSRVSASNPHQLIVIMVFMGAILTFVAYLFLRNQLRPIRRLGQAAADYGKGRITPYHPSGAVEVRAAGTAFLDMRARIERQNQSRTLMLSGISHDLRTPLTRLRLELSLLDEAAAGPMIRDVQDMERLIDAFLDYGREDSADEAELYDPYILLAEAVADAQRADIPVELITDPEDLEPVECQLRPMALRRALDNLIGNAHRYGGDKIEVSLVITDRAICLSVEDNGPGIPVSARDEAIKPFTRLDPARNQDKGTGVGLGLAIVADVARLHGGTLRLGDSDRLGGLKADIVIAR